jgi:hypothetical protein
MIEFGVVERFGAESAVACFKALSLRSPAGTEEVLGIVVVAADTQASIF